MKYSWSHAVLYVRDLEKMLDFYGNVLGFEVTDRDMAEPTIFTDINTFETVAELEDREEDHLSGRGRARSSESHPANSRQSIRHNRPQTAIAPDRPTASLAAPT